MDIIALVENMSEDMYLRLKCAAETGKWPEGTTVDQAQRESALHITMAYQARRLNNQDNMTIGQDGQIVTKTKRELKTQFSIAQSPAGQESSCKDKNSNNDQNQNPNSQDIARFSNL